MTTKQVAPKISDVIAMPPEDLQALTNEELHELHKVALTGTSRPAKLKASMIADVIDGRKKAQAKAAKTARAAAAESVANSTKPAANAAPEAKPKRARAAAPQEQQPITVYTSPTAKPQRAPAKPKPAATSTPAAPAAIPAKPAVAAIPAAPAKPVAAAAKTPRKPAAAKTPAAPATPKEPTKEELLAEIARLKSEQQKQVTDLFPNEIKGNKGTIFQKFIPQDLNHLLETMIAHPYRVYMFMDERIDETLTQCLLIYASDNIIISIDKSRYKEQQMDCSRVAAVINDRKWITGDDSTTTSFNLSLYVAMDAK